jgi:hypothetical protein
MNKPIWYPSPEFLAQSGHFLLGFVCVLFPLAFFPNWKYGALYGALAALVYMIPKEFVFDVFVEKATFAEGLKDLAYLVAGIVVAFSSYGIVILFRSH